MLFGAILTFATLGTSGIEALELLINSVKYLAIKTLVLLGG